VACLLWPHRRLLLAGLCAPIALWQWTPAWAAMTQNGKDPSTREAYYTALDHFLQAHGTPQRVEVVPTKLHWEAVYVAPIAELARGWERQLDTADNPLFYDPEHPLSATSYSSWLIDNGVSYVALPDAPLDYAATVEAKLVVDGVPGLQPVWSDTHWRVFKVSGSPGLVSGPAQLTSIDGGDVVLRATGAGTVTLRVRYNPRWEATVGAVCLAPSPGGWTSIAMPGPEDVHLALRLLPGLAADCDVGP